MLYILDDNGNPVHESDPKKWARWFQESAPKRAVAQETLNGFYVSTVFLGLDHAAPGSGKKLLYETMVFPEGRGAVRTRKVTFSDVIGGGWKAIWCSRWETREEAMAGHVMALAMIKKGEIKIKKENDARG